MALAKGKDLSMGESNITSLGWIKILRRYVWLFFKATRIRTWPNSFIPVLMATALAFKETGDFHGIVLGLSLLSILFIQMAADIFNDAFDGKEGLDGSHRLGPKRLVGSKTASFLEVKTLGFVVLGLAVLFGLPLVLRGGLLIGAMALLSLLACYFYTGQPYSLLKLGLSEVSAVLFWGFFIVFGVYYLQSLSFSSSLIYLALPCGFWSLTVLLVNHLRDFKGDREQGRKHFITLYGPSFGFLFVVLIQSFIYLLDFYWLEYEAKAGALSLLVLPFSVFFLYRLARAQGAGYNRLLALANLLYTAFGLLWIYGLLF